ncbi:MAG: hypothetical protein DRR19_07140 [Candidatus Parabeggiatoa sp. nov. 1]|nr:MAG: hypothetical protein DRR19_07140 [Gammaproteobacteria bacterium]
MTMNQRTPSQNIHYVNVIVMVSLLLLAEQPCLAQSEPEPFAPFAVSARQELKPSDANIDQFGNSVAVSGDTAVVGVGGLNPVEGGVVVGYVFVKDMMLFWQEQAKLIVSDAYQASDVAVAISGDTIVVGSVSNEAVYVFQRNGTVWEQQAKLTASDGTGQFGFSVAIDEEASTIVVGALGNVGDSGAAYAFVHENSSWQESSKLIHDGDASADDSFGFSVAISQNTIAVSAPHDNCLGEEAGVVYIFSRKNTIWGFDTFLASNNTVRYDQFGKYLSFQGDTLAIGAPIASNKGYVYLFKQQKYDYSLYEFFPQVSNNQNFASSVAMNENENILVVRDIYGKIPIYIRTALGWTVLQEVGLPASGAFDSVPTVAISDNIVVTGHGNGPVYIYNLLSVSSNKIYGNVSVIEIFRREFNFGYEIAINNNIIATVVWAPQGNNGQSYVFAYDEAAWKQQMKFGLSYNQSGFFATSIAIDNDTIIVGAELENAVYMFRPENQFVAKMNKISGNPLTGFGHAIAIHKNTLAVLACERVKVGNYKTSYFLKTTLIPLAATSVVLLSMKIPYLLEQI